MGSGLKEFENNIRIAVQGFELLESSIQAQKEILKLAEQRFEIANERYILGAISITDFTIAQREKNTIKRDYINQLTNYWISYYNIRLLTGHDFISDKKITY